MASKGTKQVPFKFSREDWPEDATTVKMSIDSEKGGVAFSDYLKVLTGTERPELFIIWKRDFDQKIAGNDQLQGDQKIDVLQRILSNEALSIVQRTLQQSYYAEQGRKVHKDKLVQKRIQEACKAYKPAPTATKPSSTDATTTTGATAPAVTTETATAASDGDETEPKDVVGAMPIPKKKVSEALNQYYRTEEYKKDVIQECMYALKLKIFGNDMTGKRAYINLRRYMQTARVDTKHGIRSWANQMAELQSYLPECLWESGATTGTAPTSFSETEMKEILDSNMTHAQRDKLEHLGWDLYYHSFNTTIDKLENLEPTIQREEALQKRISELEKQNGSAKPTSKATSGGGGKSPSKKKRPMDNTKQLCKTCGKTHAGKCWKLTSGPSKKGKFDRETINLLKEHFVAKEDSDSEQHSKPHWGRNLTNHEYSYVLAVAQTEKGTSDDEIDLSTGDVKEYRRRYRKTFEKKGSQN